MGILKKAYDSGVKAALEKVAIKIDALSPKPVPPLQGQMLDKAPSPHIPKAPTPNPGQPR